MSFTRNLFFFQLLSFCVGTTFFFTAVATDDDQSQEHYFAAPRSVVSKFLNYFNDPSRHKAYQEMGARNKNYHCPNHFRQELDILFHNDGVCHIYNLPQEILFKIILTIDDFRSFESLRCTSQIFKYFVDNITQAPDYQWLKYQLAHAPTITFDAEESSCQYYSNVQEIAQFYFKDYPQDLDIFVKAIKYAPFFDILHGLVDNNFIEPYAQYISSSNELKEINHDLEGADVHPLQKILSLPLGIFYQTSLTMLSITNANLIYISPLIKSLVLLEIVNFSNNQLEFLPAEIGQLSHLRCLDVSHNHLRDLPSEIGCLNNLQELNISHNYLQYLPDEFFLLTNLSLLSMNHNYINFLLTKFFSMTITDQVDLDARLIEFVPPDCLMSFLFHWDSEEKVEVQDETEDS